MRLWLVRISVVAAIVMSLLAFHTWNDKVDQLNRAQNQLAFINGTKTKALCEASKTNRELWDRMSKLVTSDPAGATPQGVEFRKAAEAYINSANASCLRAPR